MENFMELPGIKIPPSPKLYLLILAVVLSLVNKHLSAILNFLFLVKTQFMQPSFVGDLKLQLAELQKESAQINMADEFAKYARLQRKIIRIQDELKKEVQAQQKANTKDKIMLQCLLGVVFTGLMYYYNAEPVVKMPAEWLYPVSTLLSWPGLEPGTISFLVWCGISNSVVESFSTRLSSL